MVRRSQEELDNAAIFNVSNSMASDLEGPRCINAQLVRPTPPSEGSPSTARQPSVVCAPGGVSLGRGPPGFGPSPGRVSSLSDATPSTSTSASASRQCHFQRSHMSERVDTPTHSTQGERRCSTILAYASSRLCKSTGSVTKWLQSTPAKSPRYSEEPSICLGR